MNFEDTVGKIITEPIRQSEKNDTNINLLFDIENANISTKDREKIIAFFQLVGKEITKLDRDTRERIPFQLELLSYNIDNEKLDKDADSVIVKSLLKSLYSAYILLGTDHGHDNPLDLQSEAIKALAELKKAELLKEDTGYEKVRNYIEGDS